MSDPRPRILIVDDQPANLIAIEALLDECDAELVKATSGQRALELTINNEFALILLDIQMPEMDGYEVASLLRNHSKTQVTPIVFLTALNKSDSIVLSAYSAGAVDLLFKPLNPDILLSKVRVFLELYESRRELDRANGALEKKNREVNEFASVAAHDIKAPLRRIATFSGFLEKELADLNVSEDVTTYIETIQRNSCRLTNLVEDLLQFARVGKSGEPMRALELAGIASRALENLATEIAETEASIKIADLPSVWGDETLLIQLLQNLIANALKFRTEEHPSIEISAERIGDRWHIAVADNGIGIPGADRERIFGTFERLNSQTMFEGSGLGLSTCRKVVEHHGGQIWVESGDSGGSTFYATLAPAEETPKTEDD
ncbi:MAG: response regulator [bacterium]|nr:response regulator [bacterium]